MSATQMLGYPDWQRLTNWDGPVTWQLNAVTGAANQVSPVMDVSRYATLGGIITCTAGAMLATFEWFTTSAATTRLSTRVMRFDGSVSAFAQLRLPNMGPFCRITLSRFGAVNYTVSATIVPTNRSHPLEVVPTDSMVDQVSNSALANGQTITRTWAAISCGPAMLWANVSVAGPHFALYNIIDLNTYQLFAELVPTAAGDFTMPFMMVESSVRLVVTNTGAAATVFWGVVLSMTGG